MKDGFDASILEDIQPGATLETCRRELKAELYDLDNSKHSAESVRDAIALANTARRTARPCYLIMGVSDRGMLIDQACKGVRQGIRAKPTLEERMNANENTLLQHLNTYIEPALNVEFQWGRYQRRSVDMDQEFELTEAPVIAYLVFRFQPAEPYRVRRKLTSPNASDRLEPGDTWTRFGASKGQKLSINNPRDVALLWSHLERPYIDNSHWLAYANSQPQVEAPGNHQRLGGRCGALEEDALTFLADWLARRRTPFLYLHGGIGSGKSLLLSQFTDVVMRDLKSRLGNQDRDADVEIVVPVHIDLNGRTFADEANFADVVTKRLNFYGDLSEPLALAPSDPNNAARWARGILTDPRRRFVLIIDSLDELDTTKVPWKMSFLSIRAYLEGCQGRVQAILAGRTGTIARATLVRDWEELEILPLKLANLEAAFEAKPLDAQAALRELFDREPELLKYAVRPLALGTLLETVDDMYAGWSLDIPFTLEPGTVLDEIVTAVLRHESAKDLSTERDDARIARRATYASLAWRLDGKRERITRDEILRELAARELDADELRRAQQLSVLESWRDCAYQFTSPLLKAYFAALHARRLAQDETVDWSAELAHASRELKFWNRCGAILSALIWDQFEASSLKPLYQFIQECAIQPVDSAFTSPKEGLL